MKEPPPPPRLSARVMLIIGVCSDVLAALLYYPFLEVSSRSRSYNLLELGLCLAVLFGLVGTSIGSLMWARRAETGAVLMAAMGIILLTLIYENRARIGFDDPKIMVIPFAFLIVLLLLVGRVVGYGLSNRN